jgi:tetratricopeptide (TPR) repeat protein
MCSVLLGARRLAADIAWVQLLQYYGSPEKPLDEETEFTVSWDMVKFLTGIPLENKEAHNPGVPEEKHHSEAEHHHYHEDIEGGNYPALYSNCLRVAELDPFFSYVYLYGAGALAWNLHRPDEALKLLEAGIANMERFSPAITKDIHHPFWQYNLYISAIVYSKTGQYEQMTGLLETAIKQPGCPNMMKAILANIYQKNSQFVKSLQLWFEIYDSQDPTYTVKSQQKITELKTILHI